MPRLLVALSRDGSLRKLCAGMCGRWSHRPANSGACTKPKIG